MLVPIERVACERRRVARSGVVDGEVKGYHTVAAGHIGRIGRIIAGLSVGGAMPREVLTGNGGGVSRVAVTDRQMQRHHTVAAACVRECVRQRLCGGGDVRMLVPVEAVTSERRRVARSGVVDGEVKGYQRIATG